MAEIISCILVIVIILGPFALIFLAIKQKKGQKEQKDDHDSLCNCPACRYRKQSDR